VSSSSVLITVRHGQTDFNHSRRYAGLLDVPLNAKGVEDTRIAAENFCSAIDVVLSSPLVRALETARILTGDVRPIIVSELCRERDFGKMQGLTADEVESLEPFVSYFKVGGDFHSLDPPGGESLLEVRDRAKKFADDVLREHAGSRVLVVSHEVFLLQLHGYLRGDDWRSAMARRLPNLTLTTFVIESQRLISESEQRLTSAEQEDGSLFAGIRNAVPEDAEDGPQEA